MKPVANTSPAFPKIGDILKMRADYSRRERRVVQGIRPCDHRDNCVQNDYCTYCLTLRLLSGREESRSSQHCWNDSNGDPYWEIESCGDSQERRGQ